MAASWHPASLKDLEAIQILSERIHPELPESIDVFAERLQLFPPGCLVLKNDDHQVQGYVISHPIIQDQPPPLDSLLDEISSEANQYYIHDLAIMPELQGRGFASRCLDQLLLLAKQYPSTSLISVYGTTAFWARFGFRAGPVDTDLLKKLKGYGEGSQYLVRQNQC